MSPSTLMMPLDALTTTTRKQMKIGRSLRKKGRTPLAIKRDTQRLAGEEEAQQREQPTRRPLRVKR